VTSRPRRGARVPRPIPHRGGAVGPALPARYPEWFELGVATHPPGWGELVDQLFVDLAATLTEAERAAFRVAAVKERGGRLSVETYAPVPAAEKLIAAAVASSARVCQSCGGPGRRREFAGWAATLCPACRRRLGAMRIGGA
jgi:hypothetical protein